MENKKSKYIRRLFQIKNVRRFLKWWLVFSGIAIGTLVVYVQGLFSLIFSADVTHLTLLNLGLFYVTTFVMGYKYWKHCFQKKIIDTTIEWYIAETLMAIGILGTVSGFIIMLKSGGLDTISDAQGIKASLSGISLGVGTALYNTLVGLTGSILLKLQLVMIEKETNNPDACI